MTGYNLMAHSYSVKDIPNPKDAHRDYYVSNPDQLLSAATMTQINELCKKISDQSSAEVAVVVVKNYNGDDAASFATELYNYWKIGKKGKSNGLLLFIATDKRQYWMTSGYGVEGILTDAVLSRIGRNIIVPNLKEGQIDAGVTEALTRISEILTDPEHADELLDTSTSDDSEPIAVDTFSILGIWLLYGLAYWWVDKSQKKYRSPNATHTSSIIKIGCMGMAIGLFGSIIVFFITGMNSLSVTISAAVFALGILFMKYISARQDIMESYKDKITMISQLEKFQKDSTVAVILSPIILIIYFTINKLKEKYQERLTPPDNSGQWTRINREVLAHPERILTVAQLKEEEKEIKDYEIWQHNCTGQYVAIPFNGAKYSSYEACPQCQAHTLLLPYTEVIEEATTTSTGIGKKIQTCENCQHEIFIEDVIIPIIIAQELSDSSWDSSSDSSSSDDSGSWGGGSSGGGGAGGTW